MSEELQARISAISAIASGNPHSSGLTADMASQLAEYGVPNVTDESLAGFIVGAGLVANMFDVALASGAPGYMAGTAAMQAASDVLAGLAALREESFRGSDGPYL